MQAVLIKTSTLTVTFYFVKNAPFYKKRTSYGIFFTTFNSLRFTSKALVVNFIKTIVKIEWKRIIK